MLLNLKLSCKGGFFYRLGGRALNTGLFSTEEKVIRSESCVFTPVKLHSTNTYFYELLYNCQMFALAIQSA